jgi:hypothetical protein
MSDEKLTDALLDRARDARADALVDVVIELRRERTRGGDPADRKARFEREASPVEAAVADAGGAVLGRAWINATVRARVPARALARLSEIGAVERIDTPRRIEPEGGEGRIKE